MNWQEWQTLADNEAIWLAYEEKGLLKAEHRHDFILRLWFDNGTDVAVYDLDFRPLFVEQNPGGVFAKLADPSRFQVVYGDYALIWLDRDSGMGNERSIDLAPECVRYFCERYGQPIEPGRKPLLEHLASLLGVPG